MNVDEAQSRLWAAARSLPPSDHVPPGFEKRVMAALRAVPSPDPWALWSRFLWQAAAPCVVVMVAVGVWTVAANPAADSSVTLGAELEHALWGPLTSMEEPW